MKIIDCTTYFEEKMMMDLRFNILDPYVDRFIVCEAKFTHSGEKKEINFNVNDFPDFKNKIVHLVMENEPENISLNKKYNPANLRIQSIKRIQSQRNFIINGFKDLSNDDYIIYSDNDEIPNLKNFNFKNNKNKIILFKQKLYYYKLNLSLKGMDWFGSKSCKLKNLNSIAWLRDIKTKKYSIYRLDTLFSKSKYIDLEIVENGGWHFSNLKTIDELMRKYKNDENYSEFVQRGLTKKDIIGFIDRKVHGHNHKADKKSEKRFEETKLDIVDNSEMPEHIQKNYNLYKKWFEIPNK